jgi:hypothetical protein
VHISIGMGLCYPCRQIRRGDLSYCISTISPTHNRIISIFDIDDRTWQGAELRCGAASDPTPRPRDLRSVQHKNRRGGAVRSRAIPYSTVHRRQGLGIVPNLIQSCRRSQPQPGSREKRSVGMPHLSWILAQRRAKLQ